MELESQPPDVSSVEEVPEQLAENLPDLFTLHEKIVYPKPIDIPAVFSKEPEQTVAFEVALAALIATTVLTISISAPILEAASTVAAILLVGITMVRKMILDNAFIESDQMMRKTTGWMQYLIVFAVVYTAIFAAEAVTTIIPGDVLLGLGVGLFLAAYILAILYEMVFGDLFFWSAVRHYNRAVRGRHDYFSHGLLEMARFMLRVSPKMFSNEHPAVRKIRLLGIGSSMQGSGRFTASVVFGATAGILILAALMAVPVIYWVTGSALVYTMMLTALLGMSALPLQGLLQFVLSRYGNASFDEVSGARHDVLPMMVLLATAVLYEVEQAGLLF